MLMLGYFRIVQDCLLPSCSVICSVLLAVSLNKENKNTVHEDEMSRLGFFSMLPAV